jgi:serine/threonine-protein kinase
VDEARAEVAQAAQLAVAQLGLKHPFVADVEYAHGLILATEGDHAGAKARLQRAATLSRNAEGQPSMDTQAMELSLAREQARDGDAKAIATLQRMATAPASGGSEPRNLRWRARAYLGEVQCRGTDADAAQARADLDTLTHELRAGLPQGGRLPREVAAIRGACAPIAMQ